MASNSNDAYKKLANLSGQERRALQLRCEGLEYTDIAEQMHVSVSAIKSYMGRVFLKLELNELPEIRRLKDLFEEYCKELQQAELPPPPEEPEEPVPIPEEVMKMVDEDETSLTIWEGQIIHVPDEDPGPQPRPRWFRRLLVGMVLGALLVLGIMSLLRSLVNGSEGTAAVASDTPVIAVTEMIVVNTQEVTREVTRLITTTPEPLGPTATPIVQTQIVTVLVSATPEPVPTEGDGAEEPVVVETTDEGGALYPFSDNFDTGRREEWAILAGEPFIGNGRLGAATDTLTLAIGDDALTNYTAEFDYWNVDGGRSLLLQVAPGLRYKRFFWGASWYQFENNQWVEIVSDSQRIPSAAHMQVERAGSTFTIEVNGQLVYQYVHQNTLAGGAFTITIEDDIQLDNFLLTVP
jgi:DNA-binding CsgD family transcriptional regulator